MNLCKIYTLILTLLLLFSISNCTNGNGLHVVGNYCKSDLTQKTNEPDELNPDYIKSSIEIEKLPLGEYTYQSADMLVEGQKGKIDFKILGKETLIRDKPKTNVGCVRGDKKQAFDFNVKGIERFIVHEGGKVLVNAKNFRLFTNAGPKDKIHFETEAIETVESKPSEVYKDHDVFVFYQHKRDPMIYQIRSSAQDENYKIMLTVQYRLIPAPSVNLTENPESSSEEEKNKDDSQTKTDSNSETNND